MGGITHDPLDNVQDWSRFMNALEVQSWVDSTVEPHTMIPFDLFTQTLLRLRHDSHADVLLGLILVMMYHTMARSETPVPKTRTGAHNFDPDQHIRCRDVHILQVSSTEQVVEWGFGSIKQDKKSKRSRKDPDKREWKPVGEATGVLSMLFWFKLYITFVGETRDPDTPFFVNADGRYAVYSELLDAMRAAMLRVPGVTEDMTRKYGLHGLRVLGYNCWRAAKGEDVAQLQGGWGSKAHRTYGRELLTEMLEVPQKAAAYAAIHSLPPMPLDALEFNLALTHPPSTTPLPGAPCVVDPHVEDILEPCAEEVVEIKHVTPGGRKYSTFIYHGVTYRSKAAHLRANHQRAIRKSTAPRKKSSSRPRIAAAHVPATVWRLNHCEVSKCTLDIGHTGPHTCDIPAIPLLRTRRALIM